MKKLYSEGGAELTRILRKVKKLGATTVLDLSIPDVDGYGDSVNWRACVDAWIPLSDIMVPSAEEIFYFLDKKKFLKMKKEVGAHSTVLDHMSVDQVAGLADEMIGLGAGIAMVKCGHRGLYVRTAGAKRLGQLGAARCGSIANWAGRELWFPVYQEEKFVGALGSGDSAIAGFLAAFVRGHTLESCLRYANAAGSMNVTVPDGLSWNKGFADLTRRIKRGWKTKKMTVTEPGWRYKDQFWAGPNDKGEWEK
jgi:sugar/nucleoside kinase (ribokinase family)